MVTYRGTIEYYSSLYKDGKFIEKTHVTNHEVADSIDKIRNWMNHRLRDNIGGGYDRVTEFISCRVVRREEFEDEISFTL